MTATVATARPLDRAPAVTVLRLLAVLAVVMAPHATRLPVWVVLPVLALIVWRAAAAHRRWPLPPRVLRIGVALAGFVWVYAAFGSINGYQAGAALLVLMLGIKLTELDSRRDCSVVLFLGFFVLVTHFLFSQSPIMAAWLLIGAWLLTASLLDVNHRPDPLPLATGLRTAGVMVGQALPLMVILFVLFPRLPGPLWGTPAIGGETTRTGLSDSMSPGSISRVALSREVAFRVRFRDPVPPPAALYWRGPVLVAFDGRTWRASDQRREATRPPPTVVALGRLVSYEVILEPNGERWLLALDMPVSGPPQARFSPAAELLATEPLGQQRLYRVRSALDYRLEPRLDAAERARYLALPGDANPRTRALAARWRDSGLSGAGLARRALSLFRRGNFAYTLTPPPLPGANPVDRFLFITRRGFCEHYASAFTVLMRAAGVPARVVTGYQGGRTNPVGDYLIVRQSAAHAWSEIWLSERGWMRVDPTAAIAPDRIELGLGGALPDNPGVPPMARLGGDWLRDIKLRWDWMNAVWDRSVLAYGPRLQATFLDTLGIPGMRGMLLAMTALITGFMAILGAWLMWRTRPLRPRRDPMARLWTDVGQRLAHAGLPPRPDHGPGTIAAHVAEARPDLAGEIRHIAGLYAAIRYGGHDDPATRARFATAARRFRPRWRVPGDGPDAERMPRVSRPTVMLHDTTEAGMTDIERKVVLDTPVFDRALLDANSAEATILAAWRDGRFRAILTPEMVEDVRRLAKGADEVDSAALLTALRENVEVIERNQGAGAAKSNVEETPALGALVASGAECLVTADPGLLQMGDQYNVLSPEDFLREVE